MLTTNDICVSFVKKESWPYKRSRTWWRFSVWYNQVQRLNLIPADYFRKWYVLQASKILCLCSTTSKGFDAGRCVLTTDQSGSYALRLNLADPKSAQVLPEIISKEPLGPVVRQDDDKWFNVAKWHFSAMINAEGVSISSKNADEMLKSKDPKHQAYSWRWRS